MRRDYGGMGGNVARFSDEAFEAPLRWQAPSWPDQERFEGRYAVLERLRADHADLIAPAFIADDTLWRFMFDGPFATEADVRVWAAGAAALHDQVFYAIYDKTADTWGGVASYLRINPSAGSIEVGSITFGHGLQGTRAATEAMVLMMGWAFEAGYRRYEWKCNAKNHASRHAAQRLGLSFEGIFRQATIVKDRNRDTAWFAAIDQEWPQLKAAFETWLDPGNFDAQGQQRVSLSALTEPILVAKDPG